MYHVKTSRGAIPVHIPNKEVSDWDGHAYAFYEETCFFPQVSVIFSHTLEDAYEEYVDRCVAPLEPYELANYPDDWEPWCNADGRPVDTESVQTLGQVKVYGRIGRQ